MIRRCELHTVKCDFSAINVVLSLKRKPHSGLMKCMRQCKCHEKRHTLFEGHTALQMASLHGRVFIGDSPFGVCTRSNWTLIFRWMRAVDFCEWNTRSEALVVYVRLCAIRCTWLHGRCVQAAKRTASRRMANERIASERQPDEWQSSKSARHSRQLLTACELHGC